MISIESVFNYFESIYFNVSKNDSHDVIDFTDSSNIRFSGFDLCFNFLSTFFLGLLREHTLERTLTRDDLAFITL